MALEVRLRSAVEMKLPSRCDGIQLLLMTGGLLGEMVFHRRYLDNWMSVAAGLVHVSFRLSNVAGHSADLAHKTFTLTTPVAIYNIASNSPPSRCPPTADTRQQFVYTETVATWIPLINSPSTIVPGL